MVIAPLMDHWAAQETANSIFSIPLCIAKYQDYMPPPWTPQAAGDLVDEDEAMLSRTFPFFLSIS